MLYLLAPLRAYWKERAFRLKDLVLTVIDRRVCVLVLLQTVVVHLSS